MLFVQDADVTRDLFTTKNKLIDKDGSTDIMFRPLIGESFVFSKTDDAWKEKRKACAHAFYKDRMGMMMATLRSKIMEAVGKWVKEIEASPEGMTKIDINHEFERIFSRNIVEICFGEDVSAEKFEIFEETSSNSREFVKKIVSVREAIHFTDEMIVNAYMEKLMHPINLLWKYTGVMYSHNDYLKTIDENCRRIREYVMKYVQDRKSGKRKSKVAGGVDLLSLFLSES